MHDLIRVIVLGTGQMGSRIARLVLEKPALVLAGACAKRSDREGVDIGRVIGLDSDLGLPVYTDLTAAIEIVRPHVAIQANCSTLAETKQPIAKLLQSGVHVISIAEEMSYPSATSPQLAEEIRRIAVSRGVAVVGTGINPGFMLDLLIIVLTGVCTDIQSITGTRVNDLSFYGPSVLKRQGVGLPPEEFREGLAKGTVVGHVGFPQSIHMIAGAIGWEIERIEEHREPIISTVRRKTPFATVEPGCCAGCLHSAVAYRRGAPVIKLIHPQQIRPHLEGVETGDTLEIKGTPDIRISGSPEVPGGIATAALAVNMIPRVLSAPPGLHSMADLPVPVAMLGGDRELVPQTRQEHRRG